MRPVVDALIGVALEQRQAARARKDFAAADAIRDQLQEAGVLVEDTPARHTLGAPVMSGRAAGGGGRTKSGKPRPGTGGYGKRKLEGKGPTPPAEMRPGHPAQRRAAQAKKAALGKTGQNNPAPSRAAPARAGGSRAVATDAGSGQRGR